MKITKPRSPRVRLFALLGLLLLSALASAAAEVLHGRVSISVQHTDLAEVFEMLSRQGRVNILLGKGVDGDVSVNLYDVTLHEAIARIAAAAGYAVERIDDTYFVVSRDEAGKDIVDGLTQTRAFKVQYTEPDLVANIMQNHLSRYGKITALPDRNMLVVEELPDFMSRMERLLTEIDHEPTQILIEGQILEVILDNTDTYGLDWAKLFKSDGGTGAFGLQGLAAPGAPGLFFSLVNPNVEAALNALSSTGRVRTLSTPKLLALEHREAQVIIGDRTGYRVTTTIDQVTTESIRFFDSGIILKVIPFVDRSGHIMMDIHPEVSTATVSDGIPSLKTTEVSTQLLAADGQTIFIGGLIRNSTSSRRNGVPILRDLPLLGRLFGNSEDIVVNTETVVLITPRIMRPGINVIDQAELSRLEVIDRRLSEAGEKIDHTFDAPIRELSN